MQEILEEIGLSKNEAKVYLGLIKLNRASAGDIYKATGIHRRNIYDTLERLMEKGLVFQISEKKTNFFQAVNPEKLNQLLEERSNKLQKIIPLLTKDFEEQNRKEEVYIYQGAEGFKNYLRDILEVRQEMYAMGAKGALFDKRIEPYAQAFLDETVKRKIKLFHIFDHEVSQSKSKFLEFLPGEYKFLPPEYSSEITLCTYGDRVVSFTGRGVSNIGDTIKLFVTVSPQVAEAQRKWFKCLWEML